MKQVLLFIVVVVITMSHTVVAAAAAAAACPCSDTSLCQPLTVGPRQEFLGFTTGPNYEQFDWSHLTTLGVYYNIDPQLLCVAHSHNVRLVNGVAFPIDQLGNTQAQEQWIQQQIQWVQENNFDGINFDIEDPIWPNMTLTSALLTAFIAQTTYEFKQVNPNYQVTADVSWSPNCIDGRCYDFFGLSQATDFLVVMDYDLRSQVFSDQCTASANSPLDLVTQGMINFTNIGVPANKLVMAVPWYGYTYQCLGDSLSIDTIVCPIALVPFLGVNCSDAAGKQFPYSQIVEMLANQSLVSTGELWSDELSSPFFNYMLESGQLNQVWYDNPESLSIKVSMAKKLGLRGVSVWVLDFLSTAQPTETQMMWDAMNS
ncbi:hypothetical protein SAMD00019534_122870, partial [Acytostelium subglobosum LB1]|uniref:hypothetical protein n=1 Tax=Acytostelium subglobosum LB1 TaxID=1410327 RepID=UPI000644ABC8